MINTDELKSSINIVDVIDSLVPLKKAGKNHHACCPFHDEKTPSFTVSESKQMFHCFGCGAGGDVLKFIMQYYNVEFLDAAKILGGENDVSLSKSAIAPSARIRLPLEQKPHCQDSINNFIATKCEEMSGVYFYKDYQAVKMTDINKNLVSCALVAGKGFDNKYFNQKFLYGSCVVLGEITNNVDVILCETYQQAAATRLNTKKACVCYFEPKNLYFIYEEIKRKTSSIAVVASSRESFVQADKLNLLNCYFKKYNNKNRVDLNNV